MYLKKKTWKGLKSLGNIDSVSVTEAQSLTLLTWQNEYNGFWHLVHCSEKNY